MPPNDMHALLSRAKREGPGQKVEVIFYWNSNILEEIFLIEDTFCLFFLLYREIAFVCIRRLLHPHRQKGQKSQKPSQQAWSLEKPTPEPGHMVPPLRRHRMGQPAPSNGSLGREAFMLCYIITIDFEEGRYPHGNRQALRRQHDAATHQGCHRCRAGHGQRHYAYR